MSGKAAYLFTIMISGTVIVLLAIFHTLPQDEVNGVAGLWLGHVFSELNNFRKNGNSNGVH